MNPYLIPGLEKSATIYRHLIRLIPASDLDTPTSPDRFSPREVIAHLADWEPIMRERISAGVQEPGVTVQVWDEGQRAIDLDYASSNVEAQLDIFESERAKTVAFLKSLSKEDLAKGVVHPERGPISNSDQGGLLLGHDLYHIEQLLALVPN